MNADMLLIVRTARHRYAVRHADLAGMKMLADPRVLDHSGFYGQPCLAAELGPLLGHADTGALQRRQALMVPLRRRYVALLVDAIETFIEHASAVPLPALLRERLRQPWATGALVLEAQPVVLIDVRAVARSVMLAAPASPDRKGNTAYVSGA
ncbi:MAG TPA: hypothetical protein PLO33_15470 [Kouleothrix sp.]|uniref:hypothetical protein n=1 Tax=Kouleothrix sp. TaxID=2779161 RepID=UPI002CC8181F|nr:hypothetical protein [Kouleothrix sp.]HRC77079.1 hypothetical protein [Kouleothrix sp.]